MRTIIFICCFAWLHSAFSMNSSDFIPDNEDQCIARILMLEAEYSTLTNALTQGHIDNRRELAQRLRPLLRERHEAYSSWVQEPSRSPTEAETIDIGRVINVVTEEPILEIDIYGERRAIVKSGLFHSEMDGHGSTYYLIQLDGTWTIFRVMQWIT